MKHPQINWNFLLISLDSNIIGSNTDPTQSQIISEIKFQNIIGSLEIVEAKKKLSINF